MGTFVPFGRDQSFLLPPDLKEWLPEDDLAHFIVAAVERVPLDAFRAKAVASGKAQYRPRLMLGLLVYCYANGIFSSRRIAVVIASCQGVRGHPVGFSAACRDQLLALKGNQGAAPVVHAQAAMNSVAVLELDDVGVVTDIDTLDDLARAGELLAARQA